MFQTLFDETDYKGYLRRLISSRPGRGRGMKSALAQAAGCQTAYISHVLNGTAHFSLEQGKKISRYLGHSTEEEHFFLLLIQKARAGTEDLRSYFVEQIRQVLEKRLILKDRLEVKKTLSKEDQATYYSAWYFSAIHIMLTIPEFQTKEAISAYFGLPLPRVSEVLEFLTSVGLAVEEKGRFKVGTARIHLGSDSPMVAKHHTNWRVQAIRSLDLGRAPNEDLHYSSVVTLSKDDLLKVKSLLVESIERAKAVIKYSREETICCFSLDLFRL